MKKPAPKINMKKLLAELIKKGVVSKGAKIVTLGALFFACYFLFNIAQKLQVLSDYLKELSK